jgi:hypothetical protein
MDTIHEQITHELGNKEAWICICGNTPVADGFYPCDGDGTQVEPTTGWKELYVCERCGRIISQATYAVIGRTSQTHHQNALS